MRPDREAARPQKRPFLRVLGVLAVAGVAVLLFASLNSGSGSGDESSGQDSASVSGGGTAGQDAGATASSPTSEDCTEEFPQQLGVVTDDPQEAPYLDEMVACTDSAESAALLVNKSETVWTLHSTQQGATVTQLSKTPRLESFRQALKTQYQYPVLAPASSVVVHAAPSRTSWRLNPGFSAMWLAHEELADKVQKYGENQLTEMLSRQSLRRRALVTCSLAGWHVVGDKAENLAGSDPAGRWLAAIGIASESTSCAQAWLRADEEAASRFGRTATWGDDIASLAKDARFLELADQRLTTLSRLGKLLAHVR